MERGIPALVCLLVIAGYASAARLGGEKWSTLNAANQGYNLLVQGFRAGQLSLKKEVPPGFASLADPYDPEANRPYQLLPYDLRDLSYYGGKLYVYFGVTPVLVLFWPWMAVTGQYVFDRQALTVFCGVGFLASVGLLCALWRRYFAEVSVGVVAACALALGLATSVPAILPHSDIHEVAIGCGYMLTMLSLAAIWKAVHESRKGSGCRWLAAASLAYGLAVGARPSLLFGAIILLVPVAQGWRERRALLTPLLAAAVVPIALIGLGLMLYNALRFDSPFEFGGHYQLSWVRLLTAPEFSLGHLWFNFRVYFLEPARWSGRFPFVENIREPALPAGHIGEVGHASGVLTNIPLVWLALAAPLAWGWRPTGTRSVLCGFLGAMAALFGTAALTLGLFFHTAGRYEVEFLPALVWLAVVGILGLERRLAPASESGLATRARWQCAVRWGWGLLLGFSVLFNSLVSAEQWAYGGCALGTVLVAGGRVSEGIQELQKALRIKPDYANGQYELANALIQAGRVQEAIGHYEQAVRINPDHVEAHSNLGSVLAELGRLQEAVGHYEQALRVRPGYVPAHDGLGSALCDLGRLQEAVWHYEQALRLKPDDAEAHNNLGIASVRLGKLAEAIEQCEEAVRINPNLAGAQYNLGLALEQAGRLQEAVEHYEQALRITPDFAEGHFHLGVALEKLGQPQQAIGHHEQALRIKPDFAEAHNNLAAALIQVGRQEEAMQHWEQTLRINPDDAEAHFNLGVALENLGCTPEAIEHYQQAVRINPDFAEGHFNLGLALTQMGQAQEAIEHWEQTLRVRPDYAEAFYNMGVALENLGRPAEAIEQYRQAVRIKPDFVQAQNALARARAAP